MWRKTKKMTDFNKILDKAKELETKMKESQKKIKILKYKELQEQILQKLHLMEMEK